MEGISDMDYCKVVALCIYEIAVKSREDASYDGFSVFNELIGKLGYNVNLVNQLFAICTTYSLDRLIHGCVREYGNALDYSDAVNYCYSVVHYAVKRTYCFNRGQASTYSYASMKNELLRETRKLMEFGIPDKKVGDYYKLKQFIKQNDVPVREYEDAVKMFFENDNKNDGSIQSFLNILRLDMDPTCNAWSNLNADEEEFDEYLLADQIDSENADERFVKAVLAVEENYDDLFIILGKMNGMSGYGLEKEYPKIARFFAILDEAGKFFEKYDTVKEIKRACAIYGINGALDQISDNSVSLFSEVAMAYNDINYHVETKTMSATAINYRYRRYMCPRTNESTDAHIAFIHALQRERLFKIANALKNSSKN
jgi:hypothetical protein